MVWKEYWQSPPDHEQYLNWKAPYICTSSETDGLQVKVTDNIFFIKSQK